ncbi:monovalent cation/H(+) antiporter subunit G [Aestuariivirga sp.]|uniref:monovalent cation/H(+) antiporter subunit G n=1 Tax=Aestuariivirga sp. TaxID=2650926 RepID=UPI003BAD3C24
MTFAADIFTIIAVIAGCLLYMSGTVALLRFPDALSRLHALTKVDNLGLGLIAAGLLPQVAGPGAAAKLIAVWLLVQFSGAIVTQILARAVRERG